MEPLDGAEIEAIQEAAERAAEQAWNIRQNPNPHAIGTEAHEIWAFAFRQAFARENH